MKPRSTDSESGETLSKCLESETPAQNTVKTGLHTTINEIRTITTSTTERGLKNTIGPKSDNSTGNEEIVERVAPMKDLVRGQKVPIRKETLRTDQINVVGCGRVRLGERLLE